MSDRRVGVTVWWLAGVVAGGLITAGLVLTAQSMIAGPEPVMGGVPIFEAVTTSGVDHVYDGEFNFFVGGGVAVFDCNDDRFPDLYLAGGVNPAALYRNESQPGGDPTFTEVDSPATDLTEVTGAYPIDVDSDGITDLAVLRLGPNVMLRGLGDCRFEESNEIWGVDGGDEWTAAFSAQWEPGEVRPTMAFGNYVALTPDGDSEGGCADNAFLRPDGDRYGEMVAMSPGWCTLSILFSDWDRSGQRDLRMTNDRHYYTDGEEQLWAVAPGDPPRLYTEDDGWEHMAIWGMGIASRDLDDDGYPEVFLTSQGDNKLQALVDPGQPTYEDVALPLGATAHRPFAGDTTMPSTAWHAQFEDINNDGLTDLFVTKGNVDSMPEFAMEDPNNLLLGQPDGSFVEEAEAAGLIDYSRSRGAAVADLNLDGLLDVVVVERREPVKIWRNQGTDEAPPNQNWLEVELSQPGANPDAIGSWIEVEGDHTATQRELTIGGGHAGGQLGWAHFGLGPDESVMIRVHWPDGEIGPWKSVEANQFVILERGTDRIIPWVPLAH